MPSESVVITPALAPPLITVNPYRLVLIDALEQSPTNPRTTFHPAKLEELAASIREHGILEPLVVRPLRGRGRRVVDESGERFEIVAGARRYRASKIAGVAAVPVVVREMTDVQVIEAQLIENRQREDLDPLAEASGFKQLLSGEYSADRIAERIGLSKKYVYDRIKLLDLIPDAQQHLAHGRMAAGHAILIARLKPEDQKKVIATSSGSGYSGRRVGGLWEDDHSTGFEPTATDDKKFSTLKAVSVRELEEWIADHIKFDVEQMAAAAPLEFTETAEKVAAAEAQPGRRKKVIPITFDHIAPDAIRHDSDERVYGNTAWKHAGDGKGKPCDHGVLGVVAGGTHYGKTFTVCIARDRCRVHWAEVIRQREATAKLRDRGQTKKADAREAKQEDSWQKRQEAERGREKAEKAVWTKARPALLAALLAKVKTLSVSALTEFAFDALDCVGPQDRKEAEKLFRPAKSADDALRLLVLATVVNNSAGDYSYHRTQFATDAKKLGVDIRPILKAQTSAQPKKGAA